MQIKIYHQQKFKKFEKYGSMKIENNKLFIKGELVKDFTQHYEFEKDQKLPRYIVFFIKVDENKYRIDIGEFNAYLVNLESYFDYSKNINHYWTNCYVQIEKNNIKKIKYGVMKR